MCVCVCVWYSRNDGTKNAVHGIAGRAYFQLERLAAWNSESSSSIHILTSIIPVPSSTNQVILVDLVVISRIQPTICTCLVWSGQGAFGESRISIPSPRLGGVRDLCYFGAINFVV